MDLTEFLALVTRNAGILKTSALEIASFVIGWAFMLSAGIRLLKWSDPQRRYGMMSVIVRSAMGACLINAGTFINSVVLTVTGEAPANAMTVMPPGAGGGGPAGLILAAVLTWVGALGVIAIIRGVLLLVKAADGQAQQQESQSDPVWTGLIFIVSGAFGVNLWRFMSGLV